MSTEWMKVVFHHQIRVLRELLGREAQKHSTNKVVPSEKMSQLLSLSVQTELFLNRPLYSKVKISCGNGVTTMSPIRPVTDPYIIRTGTTEFELLIRFLWSKFDPGTLPASLMRYCHFKNTVYFSLNDPCYVLSMYLSLFTNTFFLLQPIFNVLRTQFSHKNLWNFTRTMVSCSFLGFLKRQYYIKLAEIKPVTVFDHKKCINVRHSFKPVLVLRNWSSSLKTSSY